MPNTLRLNAGAPANAPILAWLQIDDPAAAQTYSAAEVGYQAQGTHPDLIDHLLELDAALPERCYAVINRNSRPLLIHPQTGIIFALAGGTSTLACRLPEPELSAALATGSEYRYPTATVYARDFGPDWALLPPYEQANSARIARAYAYAGSL